MLNISVILNTITIIIGSIIGIFLGKKIKSIHKEIIFDSIGLVTILIGIKLGLNSNNIIFVLIAIIIGGLIGEKIGIEEKLESLGNKIEKSEGETLFVKGLISSVVLFLIGPMTILGSFQAGISNDNSLLFTKAILDGISSIAFASVYGIGVIFSAIFVYFIQGFLVAFSKYLTFLSQPLYLNDFGAVGGIIIFMIGLNLLKLKKIKAGNFMPSILIIIFINYFSNLIK